MVTRRRPLLLVHGVYHRSWCFEEHWAPRLRARGHDVLAIDLPIGPHAFSIEACVARVVEAGHSLGGRIVRAAMARAPIEHAILLSTPDDRQLARTALRLVARRPATMLRAILGGRHEHAYHDAQLLDVMFFAGTLRDGELDRFAARVREVSYPRHALARVLLMGAPQPPMHPEAHVDVVVGSRDLSCENARARRGESLHVLRDAPHDLMLGPSADESLALLTTLLDARAAAV